MLFSGQGNCGVQPETWELDDTSWNEVTLTPRPRQGHATGFDSARQRVVLFGGLAGVTRQTDTWEWDGATWVPRITASSPPARAFHAVAFDALNNKLVLFGGDGTGGSKLADTWVFDGQNWQNVTPSGSPPARFRHSMAYDLSRQRVVMFGGSTGSANLSDVWEWNDVSWTKITPATTSPSARFGHAMTYDQQKQRVLLVGGDQGTLISSTLREDVWEWSGSDWVDVTPTASTPKPGIRANSQLVYLSQGRSLLVGGTGTFGLTFDTWEWNGVSWTRRTHLFSPSQRAFHAMAYDSVRDRVVVFGGLTPPLCGDHNDTLEWDGLTWTPIVPHNASAPSKRQSHAMAYDSIRGRLVLFGGTTSTGRKADTWEWDGVRWSDVSPASSSPSPRNLHAMAYDALRNNVVLFGGDGISGRGETWTWNGASWTLESPGLSPSPRTSHAMSGPLERCELGLDGDNDQRSGCADPDCYGLCDPQCPPGGTNCSASRPRCGDLACNANLENYRICPGDSGACPPRVPTGSATRASRSPPVPATARRDRSSLT